MSAFHASFVDYGVAHNSSAQWHPASDMWGNNYVCAVNGLPPQFAEAQAAQHMQMQLMQQLQQVQPVVEAGAVAQLSFPGEANQLGHAAPRGALVLSSSNVDATMLTPRLARSAVSSQQLMVPAHGLRGQLQREFSMQQEYTVREPGEFGSGEYAVEPMYQQQFQQQQVYTPQNGSPDTSVLNQPQQQQQPQQQLQQQADPEAAAAAAGVLLPGSLYVKGLPPTADKVLLYERFAPFGAILSVNVMKCPKTGVPTGVGFVNYADKDIAKYVVETVKDHKIKVGNSFLQVSLQGSRPQNPEQQQQQYDGVAHLQPEHFSLVVQNAKCSHNKAFTPAAPRMLVPAAARRKPVGWAPALGYAS